jgi:hypothetical protein
MILKRIIYEHGGSRIFLESEDKRDRELLADTYAPKIVSDRIFEALTRMQLNGEIDTRPTAQEVEG